MIFSFKIRKEQHFLMTINHWKRAENKSSQKGQFATKNALPLAILKARKLAWEWRNFRSASEWMNWRTRFQTFFRPWRLSLWNPLEYTCLEENSETLFDTSSTCAQYCWFDLCLLRWWTFCNDALAECTLSSSAWTLSNGRVWISAECTIDFPANSVSLTTTASNETELLWVILELKEEEGRKERSGANCSNAAINQVGWSPATRNCFSTSDKTFNAWRSRRSSSFLAAKFVGSFYGHHILLHSPSHSHAKGSRQQNFFGWGASNFMASFCGWNSGLFILSASFFCASKVA